MATLFFFSIEFIIPALITIAIPALISYWLLSKNNKNSLLFSLYTTLILITSFAVLDFFSVLGSILDFERFGDPIYSILIAIFGVVSAIILITIFRKNLSLGEKNNKKLYFYLAIGILIIELVVFSITDLPILSLV